MAPSWRSGTTLAIRVNDTTIQLWEIPPRKSWGLIVALSALPALLFCCAGPVAFAETCAGGNVAIAVEAVRLGSGDRER
jgi:hypothetical protein